jgi:DNA (cytosine-5)-methyltransferase 1
VEAPAVSGAYYNEVDPNAAAWLRELIKRGAIAPGEVDERDIRDVTAADLRGFTQAHFFAGIGVWSYALRNAGWPDDRPVWTGSCPCQPFSAAGRGKGFADERHLWPAWFHLIERCRPDVIFGEQVASPDGLAWLDTVHADLEATGYALGALDLCAASVGAPHIRQRLYFGAVDDVVGYADLGRSWRNAGAVFRAEGGAAGRVRRLADGAEFAGAAGGVADDDDGRTVVGATRVHGRRKGARSGEPEAREADGQRGDDAAGRSADGELAHSSSPRLEGHAGDGDDATGRSQSAGSAAAGGVAGFWSDADWVYCRDGKYRPVEPGTFPLVDGAPARVGRLRGYGNAIVAPLATEFIKAFVDRA